ncbi:hypothetical protein [Pseudobacter ginsenosidimutans]|uniref:Outer membrane protein with beta-barrel domain n=1 Tax=Pseudobacter ginsenosidimutans TaxID=661488 RepID=A0A4Q7N0Y5_9BACT|nr:hypothetical protein [Pseudobacter ginsenosidimutans]QEC42906.1 hypothetical protein FSB84_14880 [Pseudobacter ginsenosidimutans]RZS74259.1 hypothetical protein EV199_0103 [Pseudobacter ginsenosidimutans]
MKKLSVLLFALFVSLVVSAQNGAYSKGDKLLNVGIGLNSYYSGGIPFGASFEYGVTEDISVGINADYLSHKYGGFGYDWKFTALYFGARANYHFNTLLNINNEKVDVYAGVGLGYRSFKWKDSDYDGEGLKSSYGSGVYFGILAGGKYYFTENIGGFLELGATGSTNVRLGVAFKF